MSKSCFQRGEMSDIGIARGLILWCLSARGSRKPSAGCSGVNVGQTGKVRRQSQRTSDDVHAAAPALRSCESKVAASTLILDKSAAVEKPYVRIQSLCDFM